MKIKGYKTYYFSVLPEIDIYKDSIMFAWLKWAVAIEW